ncbi:MAG: hypothetical protein KKA64_00970 [Nanoarchaeota archaeon]|nr:hypothetical protein [Nanoarchaeota archaeon]
MNLRQKILPYVGAGMITLSSVMYPLTAQAEISMRSIKEGLVTAVKVITYVPRRALDIGESVLQIPQAISEDTKKARENDVPEVGLVTGAIRGIIRTPIRVGETTYRAFTGKKELGIDDIGRANEYIEKATVSPEVGIGRKTTMGQK